MSRVVAPIYVAEGSGFCLRTFAPPSRRPELPWFAAGDLVKVLAPSRDLEIEILAGLGGGPFRRHLRTVATVDGTVMLITHPGAFLLIQFVGLGLDVPPSVMELFEDAVVGGLAAAGTNLPPAVAEARRHRAWRRGRAAVLADVRRRQRGGDRHATRF